MPFEPERRVSRRETRTLEYAFVACVLLFVVVGVTLPHGFGNAQDQATTLVNTLLVVIARFLEWLINFIGNLVLLFVDMIISVAQYNDFVHAKPVEAGWPLVRDVVNMFFIVILLITAFSTIIQYKKFQYKQVLPKLLLMAVLVNFSKTFIGLLIDVSQVIMLTFVNGFQAAAAGNFVTVLKLDKVLSLAKNETFAQEASQQTLNTPTDSFLVQIVMAELLGMFMLGISLVMLTILLVYLIVRVVGLWIALIMSPAAFFATALESTPLSKGVAFIAGSFWPRLGALLSGGPIMAFFLWLTLATVQTGGFGDFSNTNAVRQEEQQQISYFATRVGNAEEVATFLVAILMLLMGIEAAVSISGQASAQLGGVAQKIRAGGLAATRFATYGGALLAGRTAGRLTARGAGAAARGAGRFVDSRVFQERGGLTGIAGRTLQTIGREWVPGEAGARLARKGGQIRGIQGERRKAAQKRVQETTAEMSEAEKLKALEKEAGWTTNPNDLKAIQIERAKTMTSKGGIDALKEKYKAAGLKKGYKKDSPELEAYMDEETRKETGKHFAELQKIAKDTGDADIKKYADEFQEKRPDLLLDDKDFEKDVSSRMDKGINEFTKIPEEAWKDGRLMSALVADTDGLLTRNAKNEVVVNTDHEVYKKLMQTGGRSKIMKQQLNDLVAEAGGATASVAAVRNAAGKHRTMEGRMVYQKTGGQGGARQWAKVNPADLKGPAAKPGKAAKRAEDRIAAATQRVGRFREELKGTPANQAGFRVSDMRQTQYAAMTQDGATMKEAYGLDDEGKLGSDIDRQNLRVNVQQFMKEKGSDPVAYRNFDVSELYENPKGENEARRIVAATSDVGRMGEAWHSAETMGSTENLEHIQAAVGAVHLEGSRVQDRIEEYNRTHTEGRVDVNQVATAALANDANALQTAAGRMGDKAPSMDEARALANKFQIDNPASPLQNFRKVSNSRAHRHLAQERVNIRDRAAAGAGTPSPSPATPPPSPEPAEPETPPSPPPAADDAGDALRAREDDRDDS